MEKDNFSKEILEKIVKEKVKKLKNFYIHLFIFIIGVIVYISKTYLGVPINFWPINFINEFFMWCWTFIIAVDAIQLFFSQKVLGKNWEIQRIRDILEKEKVEKQNWE